ncbi:MULTISPECIES: HigA family addiction module antitoxin [Alloalcanivorax]|jgi:antitoxin HigA-1|uniref:HigA family addiction module antitoxin n=2 Tax=Alloalcanivorax TaxID=3020832 RepID=A0A9Q3W7F8_9GAMM|nr:MULTISPECIES: HigA family addiction module antitoxin [Alloalcanivorax]KYZ87107.1 transcriptional regulator [Alcanivorax sp. KX64203]MBA4722139.1 HigA family addiction module antidote protein [Alcanivorax sp.]ARB45293.1 hypothetical protein P40_07505 [Alloalcanivorax xenomutans]MCE7510528.1 HigA family addiction module antitoxin [Alloalcanivorax xenomutans]MCE7524765.1 HigA family addiction module antitoxin [Alloalcanivorax xenomutans]
MIQNGMRPVHPGEVLREEFLEPLGISAHALSRALHVSAPRVNEIVRERRGITADTAMRLARFFNTTPHFWMNLQAEYDIRVAENMSAKVIAEEVEPYKAACV